MENGLRVWAERACGAACGVTWDINSPVLSCHYYDVLAGRVCTCLGCGARTAAGQLHGTFALQTASNIAAAPDIVCMMAPCIYRI